MDQMFQPFHQAAKDGRAEFLQSGNSRDLNEPDEDGMTPVHWAAASGHLEALRISVGRGGDPDRTDLWGNAALHFAARQNHLNCLTFLVNFGANVWALDNDGLTVLELAGINDRQEVMKFLDAEMGRQMIVNPKLVEKKKTKAKIEAEKRLKKLAKLKGKKQPADELNGDTAEEDQVGLEADSVRSKGSSEGGKATTTKSTLKPLERIERKLIQTLRITTGSRKTAKSTQPSFSHFVGNDVGHRKNVASKIQQRHSTVVHNANQILHENKLKSESVEDVLYASPNDLLQYQRQPERKIESFGLFERPGFGTVAFRTVPLSQTLIAMESEKPSVDHKIEFAKDSFWRLNEVEVEDDDDIYEDGDSLTPLETFLEAYGLSEFTMVFTRERITLESLMLLDDMDLADLKIPMGPRKILLGAVAQRKRVLDCPGPIVDVPF